MPGTQGTQGSQGSQGTQGSQGLGAIVGLANGPYPVAAGTSMYARKAPQGTPTGRPLLEIVPLEHAPEADESKRVGTCLTDAGAYEEVKVLVD